MSQLPSILALMSPPEAKPLDSFGSPNKLPHTPLPAARLSSYTPENTLPPMVSVHSPASKTLRVLPSPPVSPWTGHQHQIDQKTVKETGEGKNEERLRDPVLYPTIVGGVSTHQPLFPTTPERLAAEELVTKHMSRRRQPFDRTTTSPTRDDYLLALSLVSNVGKMYNRNPGAYLKRTREETDEYYSMAKRICARPGMISQTTVKIAPAPSHSSRLPKKSTIISKPPKMKPFTRVRRTPKTPSPLERGLSTPSLDRSGTPESRIPAMKRPEDVDYNALPDYAPPTSTLPLGNSKSLKTDWASNNPLDLSKDPDRHMLHDAEINLASTLRLTCATYLCSKRRIFEGRLRAFKNKKEFRKTDAQQACKIDVNKASKLWTAYDKVGWFNKIYLEKFL
ncbi:hypothetical protein MMC11_009042 [Xylographa trunciseda]|nr:hypothetical protein [Xylographa trunciseda]